MKTSTILLLLLTSLLPVKQEIFAQKKDSAQKAAQNEKIYQQLEKKEFIVNVEHFSTPRLSRDLIRDRDLILHKDSAYASLPYIGRAYVAPNPNDDGGIHFKNIIENYRIKKVKRGYEVNFDVRHGSELYEVFLNVSPDNYVSLRISSPRRSSISYSGSLILPQ